MILDILFRQSIENPKVPLSDEGWGFSAKSDSGVDISYSTALRYSPWWRGVNLISRDVAKLPLAVYKRQGEGKDKDQSHPAYPLLRRKSNPDLTAFTFIQTLTANAMSCGNGYSYIVRDGSGRPTELRWMDPASTFPARENGNMLYITLINNVYRRLLKENVLHIHGLGYDGLTGYSVFRLAADSLGLGIGAAKYESKFFANNARPSVMIEVPGVLTEQAIKVMRAQWDAMHAGLDNAHKTGVLTNGAKVNAFSINARDSQLLETREFEIREVANWLGVPPHKLGDTTRTAYASLEQENYSYLVEALDPWLCTWENECNDKLLSEAEKTNETRFVEFNRNALVRASFAERMAGYNTALQGGWMSRNEVRAKENMNPIEDEGDKFYQPLNMQTVGGDVDPPKVTGGTLPELQAIIISVTSGEMPADAAEVMIAAAYPALTPAEITDMLEAADAQEPPEPPQPSIAEPSGTLTGTPAESMRGIVEDVAERMAKRISIAARKAAKKPAEFLNWLDIDLPNHTVVIADALNPVASLVRTVRSETSEAMPLATSFVNRWQERLLQLSGECTPETMPAFIDGALNELEGALKTELVNNVIGV